MGGAAEMSDTENIVGQIQITVDKRVFAVCRDCGLPMYCIYDQSLRDFCYEHTPRKRPAGEVDLSLCKGL
jgi:hypothetical protein